MDTLADQQARTIVDECCQKKFGDNATSMATWLGTSLSNLQRWRENTTVPAWAIMKIFSRWEDIRHHFLVDARAPISVVDPDKEKLMEEIGALLQVQGWFDRFKEDVEIYKAAQHYLADYGVKSRESRATLVNDPKEDFGSDKKRPAGTVRPRKIPADQE